MSGPSAASGTRRLIVLGATGSIGTQTLEVVAHLNSLHARGEFPTRLEVVGLAAGRSGADLAALAAHHGVREAALADDACSHGFPSSTKVRTGPDAAERLVREVPCDMVLAAMVGSAGLPATLAAVELGRDVALANKETLVAAGALIVPAARKSGSRLLPVDSEHAAVWQCLRACGEESPPPLTAPTCIERVILTASGGPFRTWARDKAYHATRDEALNHPTWSMGPKVTIDSASLTNKALEIIEAHWLFGLEPRRIGVLLHPQSVVHAIVELRDGSVIAQMGAPDMRAPIQHALSWPHRAEGLARKIDWQSLSRLEFSPPDLERFPALGLAYDAIEAGGTAGAVLNAANEAAVGAFLEAGPGALVPFGRITELAAEAMAAIGSTPVTCLADVMGADAEARAMVRSRLGLCRA